MHFRGASISGCTVKVLDGAMAQYVLFEQLDQANGGLIKAARPFAPQLHMDKGVHSHFPLSGSGEWTLFFA